MLNWKPVSQDFIATNDNFMFRLRKTSVTSVAQGYLLEIKKLKDISFQPLHYYFYDRQYTHDKKLIDDSVDQLSWNDTDLIKKRATEILEELYFVHPSDYLNNNSNSKITVNLSNITSSKKVREKIAEMFTMKLEVEDCIYDIDFVLEKLQEIDEHIKNESTTVVLEEMNFWGEFHDVIDVALSEFGFKINMEKSDFDNYKWVYIKQ